MKEEYHDVIVAGAGASGLMAAGIAASRGRDVLILEKMEKPGRKLRITGKGRCNITNVAPVPDFLEHIGPDSRFLQNAFGVFFNNELIEFFESIGVRTIVERGGRVFPASGSAVELTLAMEKWVSASGVTIRCREQVAEVEKLNDVFVVRATSGRRYKCKSFLVATGGMSYPATGSDGDGYKILRKLGHSINAVMPALVPLVAEMPGRSSLRNLHLKNVSLLVRLPDGKEEDYFGELEFDGRGIAGPVALTVSRRYATVLNSGQRLRAFLDWKPALEPERLLKRIMRDIETFGPRNYFELLKRLVPVQAVNAVMKHAGCSSAAKPGIEDKELQSLVRSLSEFPVTITGTAGFSEAVITRGGAEVREVFPKSMESRKCSGLYIAGEILDLDADTGGYNLQIAFSTGYLAGMNM